MKRFVVLGVLAVVSGCSGGYEVRTTTRALVDPHRTPSHLAAVCMFRPDFIGYAVPIVHKDNGKVVGVTRGMGVYFCYQAQPGWHRLTAHRAPGYGIYARLAYLPVYLRAGERRYFRISLRFGPDRLLPIHAATAQGFMQRMRYIYAVRTDNDVARVYKRPVPAWGGQRGYGRYATRGGSAHHGEGSGSVPPPAPGGAGTAPGGTSAPPPSSTPPRAKSASPPAAE